ncbi:hypothetical protein C3B59_04080 [Cryobacterium zongtaii]|uniref:DUF2510 domain-containing protein n=1 Tax=Cryobacterium zongtaii TaxID=1259217 RepID=A0A2S3ZP49_9MICO|nr:DUF2510 domain-containing protein [Cryobacterium zongtaii]POH70852.1 hypothetical protein C3B59_04080 [Cryobacterium zongtaii]
MTELAPAGWYDDTTDAEQLRWWTGTAWTDARAPRQPAPTAEVAAESPTGSEPAAVPVPLPYGPASVTGAPAAYPVSATGLPVAASTTAPGRLKQLRTNNPFAFFSMIIGLMSLMLNLLGLPAIAALVLGILGVVRSRKLARAGAPITGLVVSIVGIVLAALVTLRFGTTMITFMAHVYS